jgi:hypothetical protein
MSQVYRANGLFSKSECDGTIAARRATPIAAGFYQVSKKQSDKNK